MKKQARAQSTCPITYSVNIIGDPWSLLIARDIIFHGKHTYGEFLESGEYITTSMLADKLDRLEQEGLIAKTASSHDKRKMLYILTHKGLDLFIPVLVDLANWGVVHNPRTTPNPAWVRQAKADREELVRIIRMTVLAGGAVFRGKNSVISQLESLFPDVY
jgi:DNA-binding HxlR family transcriptional regulator